MEPFIKTAIVILTYNNIEYSRQCIQSIREHTEKGTYEIIVVDNNSTDGTQEWLLKQEDIKLQLNQKNEGFPKGCNMGIKLAGKQSDILLLNNDTVVTPRWLENLNKCLYSDERNGAAGAVCNHNENLQWGGFTYENLDEMQPLADENNVSDSKKWEEKIFLIGFCLLVKRQVFDEIGALDENYSPGYVEDNDLSLRIAAAGYRLMLCHDCFVHHVLGSGFRKDLNQFYPVLYANRAYFKKKGGFETIAFDEIRNASVRLLKEEDKDKRINVLELGCGIGVTLLKIQYEYKNASLFGIEPDENMAAIARCIANVSAKTIDAFPLDFNFESFDYILAGNALETQRDPEGFLIEIKKYLKTGGWIIAEMQNVMHYSQVRDLLAGNWLYGADNKPGRANKNFFTLEDVHRLFSNSGYRDPYVFHWFSLPDRQAQEFIKKLCDAGGEKREYLYTTYLFAAKYRK
jgi:GT2 family glycosyltransferase/ubiquinone/menaquinone biosynthesis C-methylase UbiE